MQLPNLVELGLVITCWSRATKLLYIEPG